nr:hypothetical protein [Tanacetum cinerariifolium]
HNQNSLNDSPSISETSSQSPLNINHCCYECGDPLDVIFCKRCTCKFCGKDAHTGYNCPSKVSVISNPKPWNSQTIDELPQTLPNFHSTFHSEAESLFTLDSTHTYVDESPNVFNPPPQSPVYPCEFCGKDAYYGHYCTPQAPFIYQKSCYNQDLNFPQDFQTVPQQYPCCDDCGVTRDAYQCQPMNEVYYYGQNSCYDSTSIGFNQSQPQQYTVNHPIFNAHNSYIDSQIQLNSTLAKIKDQMTSITSLCEMAYQVAQKKLEEKQIEEERAAKAKYWKLPSGVETLILILSESEGTPEHVCDVPSRNNSPPLDVSKDQIEDFSESNEEFSSNDNDSFSIADIDYVEASPPDSELVSSEVMEIVIPEVGGIDDDILLTIKDDILRARPKISSGSTTTAPDISLLEYEVFHDDHVKEISSGSPTTHSDSSLFASFMFDLSINPFPPVDRSDSYEFTDELIPFISAPELKKYQEKDKIGSKSNKTGSTHIPLRPNLGVLQIDIKSQGYREPDTVMSNLEDSTVTYTEVSSSFEDLSDIGSLGFDGLPKMPQDPYAYVEAALQAPPSPDYVPGPEYPPTPEFVSEHVYPEFMPPEDDILLAEEQPLPAADSPTADSPRYILESNPEEDPKEDDEDLEEDPADYPTDKDDDDDNEEEEEEESSRDEFGEEEC